MRNFYNTCKFSALAINFSEVWPRQIRDLGKQFKLMIHLETFLKTFLQDALKVSSRCLEDVFKMSWRRFEDVLKTFLQDVLKAWRRLGKMIWKRLEDFLKTYDQGEYIGLDQDVMKTSSEDEEKRHLHQDECLLEYYVALFYYCITTSCCTLFMLHYLMLH